MTFTKMAAHELGPAALVAFLASGEAAHITGTPIWIDGGETLVAGSRLRRRHSSGQQDARPSLGRVVVRPVAPRA